MNSTIKWYIWWILALLALVKGVMTGDPVWFLIAFVIDIYLDTKNE